MIYKLRKEIDLSKLSVKWLVYNSHPGSEKIIQENLDQLDLDDFSRILHYPHFMGIIVKQLTILNSPYLSKNEDAMHILMKNPDLIDWYMLSTNPSSKALEMIEQTIINENIITIPYHKKTKLPIQCPQTYSVYPAFWRLLATNTNPKALEIIEKYYVKFNSWILDSEVLEFWRDLSKNEHAGHLLEKYPEYINWETILENPSPKAISMIEKNLDKIYEDDWPLLSGNPSAIHIFEKQEYLNKVFDWSYLCENPNPKAIIIILNNWDKVDWLTFSRNPSAIHIILELLQQQKDYDIRYAKNIELKQKFGDYTSYFYENDNIYRSIYKYYNDFYKVNFNSLSMNPAIFEKDYHGLKQRCDVYRKELIDKAIHPSRLISLLEKGVELDDLENYF